jgi:hypothetical protein
MFSFAEPNRFKWETPDTVSVVRPYCAWRRPKPKRHFCRYINQKYNQNVLTVPATAQLANVRPVSPRPCVLCLVAVVLKKRNAFYLCRLKTKGEWRFELNQFVALSGTRYETALDPQNFAQEKRPKPETEAKQGKAMPDASRRLRLPNLKTLGTCRWLGCQPYAPAAFANRKYSWYSFLLEAESTPGP